MLDVEQRIIVQKKTRSPTRNPKKTCLHLPGRVRGGGAKARGCGGDLGAELEVRHVDLPPPVRLVDPPGPRGRRRSG